MGTMPKHLTFDQLLFPLDKSFIFSQTIARESQNGGVNYGLHGAVLRRQVIILQ